MLLDVGVTLARVAVGLKIAYDCFSPNPIEGTEHPNKEYARFISSMAKTVPFSNKILVREVDWGSQWSQTVASTFCLRTGICQIQIPKCTPFSEDELKLISAHELGHLVGYHGPIFSMILASNALLLVFPTLSFSTVLTTWAISALFLVPLFMWTEREADAFALQNTPIEVLKASLVDEGLRRAKLQNKVSKSWTNDLLEFFVFRSKERREALQQKISSVG